MDPAEKQRILDEYRENTARMGKALIVVAVILVLTYLIFGPFDLNLPKG